MRNAGVSAFAAFAVSFGALVAIPMSMRAQAPAAIPSTAAITPVLRPAMLATQATTVTLVAETMAVKAVEASALDNLEFAPMPAGNAAESYPLPERNYIASGLWKVGSSELDKFYHHFDCPQLKRRSRNQLLGFPEWREALAVGYQPHLGCTPSPLHEFIAGVRDERRKVTQRGEGSERVADTELIRIRNDVGATSVSEKILSAIGSKMTGRGVTLPSGVASTTPIDPNNPGGDPTGGGGGLPAGMGGGSMGAGGAGMGMGPGAMGMGGGRGS